MPSKRQIVLNIVGPTATGKTDVSLAVAKALLAEVISADSMQIYDDIHIGSARPLLNEMGGVAHHLMGFLKPDETYNVAKYQIAAKKAIEEISNRGNYPLVVGGTGLYVSALQYDIDFSAEPDYSVREKLEGEYDVLGAEAMFARLQALDAAAAERIHKNDKKRVIRRLEILQTGETKAYDFRKEQTSYDFITLGITKQRAQLYADIDLRVDQMITEGLEEEVTRLYKQYGADITAFTAIGYKEFLPYFRGEVDLDAVVKQIKQDTRRFAKRQMTWFRREENITWMYADAYDSKEALNNAVVAYFQSQIGLRNNT